MSCPDPDCYSNRLRPLNGDELDVLEQLPARFGDITLEAPSFSCETCGGIFIEGYFEDMFAVVFRIA